MKFKFTGVPGEAHEAISMYGTTFPLGKWIDLDENDKRNRDALHKLPRHPFFEASDEAKALKLAASLGDPVREAQREVDQARDAQVAQAKATAEADRAQEAMEIAAQDALIAEFAAKEQHDDDSRTGAKGAAQADDSFAGRGRQRGGPGHGHGEAAGGSRKS